MFSDRTIRILKSHSKLHQNKLTLRKQLLDTMLSELIRYVMLHNHIVRITSAIMRFKYTVYWNLSCSSFSLFLFFPSTSFFHPCSLVNKLLLSFLLKGNFALCRIPEWGLFSFSIVNVLPSSLLVFIVVAENSLFGSFGLTIFPLGWLLKLYFRCSIFISLWCV